MQSPSIESRRAVLGALAATPVLFAAGSALAGDPDAELHHMIAEYWRLDTEERRIARGVPEDAPDLTGHLLPQIEAFEPQTLGGAVAKLRFGIDDDELQFLLDGAVFDRIGGTAILDICRIAGVA